MRRSRQRGFTLIELLIVVAIIGLVSAIAVPALLNAIDRGRQSGTLADMRAIATAVERYAIDNKRYPAAKDIETLAELLEPSYIPQLPRVDDWDHKLQYGTDEPGLTYTLRSVGKDGAPQSGPPTGVADSFDADIIMVNGTFLQRPKGQQR